jgi:hypothetical protein
MVARLTSRALAAPSYDNVICKSFKACTVSGFCLIFLMASFTRNSLSSSSTFFCPRVDSRVSKFMSDGSVKVVNIIHLLFSWLLRWLPWRRSKESTVCLKP